MESNMKSGLESSLSYKSEASLKSVMTVQQGSKSGVVLEVETPLGTYYIPVETYKNRQLALTELRRRLR